MSDRTGFAAGRLSPIIYFCGPDGQIALPPTTEDARRFYNSHYKHMKWEWCEAGTLAEVDILQKRLVEIETRKAALELERDERLLSLRREVIRESLYQRMISSSTGAYEKEFIAAYLQLREEKRAKYRQRFMERTHYLWAREQDSHTTVADRMPSQPGEIWRNEAQMKD